MLIISLMATATWDLAASFGEAEYDDSAEIVISSSVLMPPKAVKRGMCAVVLPHAFLFQCVAKLF